MEESQRHPGELKYENPANKIEIPKRLHIENPRILVTLCSYIPQGLMAQYSSRLFNKGYTYIPYLHNRLECLKFVLASYKHIDAGLPFDLVIVDNDSPSHQALAFLKNLDIPVISRENTYYSFGAYKAAWDQLGKDYDYFVFHEMDWTPARHNWLRYLVDIWESDSEIGMIGNLIESRQWTDSPATQGAIVTNRFIEKINKNRKLQYNLDSEYFFTDRVVLSQMDRAGWLLFECVPKTGLPASFNELAFQQPLLEMGYKLRCFNDNKHTMFHGLLNRGLPQKWKHGFENLAPFIPEQVRLFIPEYRDYFGFYKHDLTLSLLDNYVRKP